MRIRKDEEEKDNNMRMGTRKTMITQKTNAGLLKLISQKGISERITKRKG